MLLGHFFRAIKHLLTHGALLGLLVSQNVWGENYILPEHQPTPGGVALVDIGPTKGSQPPVILRGKKRVTVIEHEQRWLAVVGIPLSAKTGAATLKNKSSGATYNYTVEGKSYPEQWLTIKNKNKVNPNKNSQERIKSERTRKWRAKNHFREVAQPPFRMQLPVTGPFSSQFGLKRFFNKQPRNPHGGLDIAVPRHTPIKAPADGIVVEAKDFFFSGNCVFIDHGQGLTSFFAHMTDINVEIGQAVKQGDLIGTVGDTGRVTGPHLHWSIGLNGTWVDPSLFLAPKDRPKVTKHK